MTIFEYLKGSFNFEFNDNNINAVLTRRGVAPEIPIGDVDEKSIDLAMADLYIILANAASGGGKKVQKGNRSVSARSYQLSLDDRRMYIEMANKLYAKWGETLSVNQSVQFIHLMGDY